MSNIKIKKLLFIFAIALGWVAIFFSSNPHILWWAIINTLVFGALLIKVLIIYLDFISIGFSSFKKGFSELDRE